MPERHRSRRWMVVAALVVATVAVLWTTCSRADVADVPPAAGTPAVGLRGPRARVRDHEVPSATAVQPTESTTRPEESESQRDETDKRLPVELFPQLRVEVAWADGTPAARAKAYALPAGSPGLVDAGDDELPLAFTDQAGACVLSLPDAGLYDIGALATAVDFALLHDVRVPEAGAVRLVLPRRAEVEFELGADLPQAGPISVDVRHARAHGAGDSAKFPGRGEVPTAGKTYGWDRASFPVRVQLPGGVLLIASARAGDQWLSSNAFTPPARVTLGIRSDRVVEGYFTFSPPELRWDRRAWIEVEIDWGVGAHARRKTLRFDLPPGRPLRDSNWSTGVGVDRDSGVMRWSGPGIEPGEASWRFAPGAQSVRVPVTIHVADAAAIPQSPVYRVVRAAALPPGAEVSQFLVDENGNSHSWSKADLESTFGDAEDAGDPRCWAIVTYGDEVGGPVRADPRESGETLIELHRGGFLVPESTALPPPQVGAVTLAREDRRPFLIRSGEDGLRPVVRCPLERDLVLGPLPAGDVVFDVHVGLRRIGVARGVVRPGERTALDLPDFTPRPR